MQQRPPEEYTIDRIETYEFPLTTPSNYYAIRIGESLILIDAGAHENLKITGKISGVLLTHWHWDHSRGIVSLEDTPICAGRDTIRMLSSIENISNSVLRPLRAMGISVQEASDPIAEFFKNILNMYNKIVNSFRRNPIYEYEKCPLKDIIDFRIIPCPGHTNDHSCIIIGNTIFVGDNVTLGESPTTINYRQYMHTINRILAEEWRTLAPGHGRSLDREGAREYFATVIDRKNRRMTRVVAALARGVSDFNELLKIVYGLEPKPQSYVPARTLIGYLKLLEDYGLVRVDWEASPLKIEFVY